MPNENGLPTEQDFVPPAVRRGSAAADAIHNQAYPPVEPTPPAPAAPSVTIIDPATKAPITTQSEPPKTAVNQDYTDPANAADIQTDQWAGRYNSMRGRYVQATTTNGQLQEQLGEMGEELIRTQQALAVARGQQHPSDPVQPQRPQTRKLLTEEDVKAYGPELIDFVQRAAREGIAPDLQNVSQALQQTNQRVTRTAANSLYAELDDAVPEWRTLNNDPEFKSWAALRDVYSGMVRGKLMNGAFQAADAPRVAAFFKGYLAERKATGHDDNPVLHDTTQQATTPPRVAAVQLDTLAAPGRAKPASGADAGTAAEKPVYTRAQIARFYSDVRRGAYAGNDAEKNRLEQSIFLAQNEGRVR